MQYKYEFQDDIQGIHTYVDANWARDKGGRRSTSGGVILHGPHYLRSWSKIQSVVAQSSAESELNAIAKASAETLFLRSVMQELGKVMAHRMPSDASALGDHSTPRTPPNETCWPQFSICTEAYCRESFPIFQGARSGKSSGLGNEGIARGRD